MNILYCLLQKERGNADDEKENSNSQTKKVFFIISELKRVVSPFHSGYQKTSSLANSEDPYEMPMTFFYP